MGKIPTLHTCPINVTRILTKVALSDIGCGPCIYVYQLPLISTALLRVA